MRYYAIKRPDGSWIMCFADTQVIAWRAASAQDTALRKHCYRTESFHQATIDAETEGYRCCEVRGFTEVENED